jgi:glucokinase
VGGERPPVPAGQLATRHLGLDLGGTNIKVVVLEHDQADWRVLEREHEPTEGAAGPAAVIERLAAAGSAAMARWPGMVSVGIGVPGLYDPRAGTTRFLVNLPGDWAGKPVAGVVGGALGLPTHLVNDARAFGLAELRLGAGRGARSLVGLVMGTGLGGVIAINGRVHQGHDGTAGELGHMTIDPDGPACNCGNHGCLEAFVRADRLAAACGTRTPEEAEERARAGDAQALAGLAQVGRYLGIGIGNAIVAVTPDRVVIGGGVAGALDLLLPSIRQELRARIHVTALEQVKIVPAALGPWAGGIGAAVHGAESVAEAR